LTTSQRCLEYDPIADPANKRRVARTKRSDAWKRRHFSIAPSRHLRVLHISGAFPPWRTGGVAAHVDYLVRALIDLHDSGGGRACGVRVLTAGDDSSLGEGRILAPNLICYPIAGKSGHFLPGGEIPLGDSVYKALQLHRGLWDEGQAHIIHVHDFESAFLGMLLKSAYPPAKLVMTVHKTPKEWESTKVHDDVKDCYLQAIRDNRLADLVFAPSSAYKRRLIAQRFGRRVRRIYHGVPVKRLLKISEQPDVLKRMRLSEGDKFVLMPCRLDEHKGPDVFVQAVAVLRERARKEGLLFAITGAGRPGARDDATNFRNAVLNLIDDSKIEDLVRVGADGRDVPAQEMPTLYRRALICVVPSRRDGFPLAVLASFVFGRPVVAARIGGIPEMIDSEVNGLLFDSGEPQDLARKLEMLLNDPNLAERLGAAGLRTVRDEFNADGMAREYFACYSELAYGHGKGTKRKGTALSQRSRGLARP